MKAPRLRRHHLVLAVPLLVAVGIFVSGALAGGGAGAGPGATAAIDVPRPAPRPQLVPRQPPKDFDLVAWSESAGAGGNRGWLELFSSGKLASDQPWVRVQYSESDDLPPALAARGWVTTPDDSVERMSGPVGAPAGKRLAVVVGRGLAPGDLARVAHGLRAVGTRLQPSWLPSGVRPVGNPMPVDNEEHYGRTLTFARDASSFTLKTTYGRYRDVRQLLAVQEDAEIGSYGGSDALVSRSTSGHVSIRWLPRPGVLAELEADSIDARAIEPSLTDLVPQPFGQFAGRVPYRPLTFGADEGRQPLVTLDEPLVPIVDTTVGGGDALALAGVGTSHGGERVVCVVAGGGGGCSRPTKLEGHYAISATRGPGVDGEAGVWLVVGDEVTRVVVRYRGLRPRSLVPVQPSPSLGDRLTFVYQPPNHAVRSIELMGREGGALARIDAPIGPEMLIRPR